MARYCQISGVGPLTGNNRSHSLRATRRRWNVNLQTIQVVDENGTPRKIKVSARTLRTLKKYEQKGCECSCHHHHDAQAEETSTVSE